MKNPYYEGDIDYGDRAEHCWNGDHVRPNAISRLRYHQMYIFPMAGVPLAVFPGAPVLFPGPPEARRPGT